MHLDLSRIHEPGGHVERTYAASAFETVQDDFRVAGDVTIAFDIERKGDRFRLVGRLTASLELACGRCTEAFQWPVDVAFDLTYLPQAANAGEGETEVGADDLDCAFYADQTLDLGQLSREQFYLSLPMKPLCTPTCQGLCPLCGINRNTGACACDTRWEDPRLAPLRGLVGRRSEPQ